MVVAYGSPTKIEFFAFFLRAVQAAVLGFTGPPMDPLPLPFQVQDPKKLRQEMIDAGLKNVRVEQTEEVMEFNSGKQFWDWIVNSNPIVGTILGSLELTSDQIATIQNAADDLIRERAAGARAAILTSPINIGIGTK